MNKKIATALLTLLTLGTGSGFAQESLPVLSLSTNDLPFNKKQTISIEEKVIRTDSFTYLRMGIADSYPEYHFRDGAVLPELGLGYRFVSGASALDLSASYSQRYSRNEEGKTTTYFYTLPKANYLYYLTPEGSNSVYLGGGLAWGGLKNKSQRTFVGLIPNIAAGVELNRHADWHTFIQLDVSQPLVDLAHSEMVTHKHNSLGPFAEISFGAGF
jgi:hypothetical protein